MEQSLELHGNVLKRAVRQCGIGKAVAAVVAAGGGVAARHRTEFRKPFTTREGHSVDLFFEKIELVENQKEILLFEGGMSYDAFEKLLAGHHLVDDNSIPV